MRYLLPISLLVLTGCADSHSGAPHAAHSADSTAHSAAGTAHSGEHETAKLQPLMKRLGDDMAEIHAALWREDLAGASKSATAIAEHPHVDADERARITKVLGDDFSKFVEGDRAVHSAATRLSKAAAGGDMDATLLELAQLQTGCVSCHASFRKRLLPP